jgi:hypothetical protein
MEKPSRRRFMMGKKNYANNIPHYCCFEDKATILKGKAMLYT